MNRASLRLTAVFACVLAVAIDARQATPVSALSAQIDRIFSTRDYERPTIRSGSLAS